MTVLFPNGRAEAGVAGVMNDKVQVTMWRRSGGTVHRQPHIRATEAMQSARVLIVDDSGTARRKLSLAVRALGHQTEAVADAESAVRRLRDMTTDLVLLDMLMPGLDGFAVLEEMKSDPMLRHIPVIVVSALENDPESVARAIELGADDFLPKDFHPTILEARIQNSLERKRQRDLDLAYQKDINRLIGAAQVIETGAFRPAELDLRGVASREDALGRLAQVFSHLAQEVYDRERRFDIALRTLRGTLLVIGAGAFFGIAPAIGRIAFTAGLPPLGVVFWANLTTAAVCLAVAFARAGVPRLGREDLRFLFAWAIILGCLYQPLTVIVAGQVEATMIALVGSSRGFIVFLLAAALTLEAPSMRRFLGLGLGFVAVAAVLLTDTATTDGTSLNWLLAAIALPALLAIHTLLMSWRRGSLGASASVGIMMAMSALLLAPIAAASDSLFLPWDGPDNAVWLILVLGISTAVALVLAVDLVTLAGPVFASQMAYSQTLAGIAWAVLLLDERLSPLALAALGIVIVGFWLVAPRSANGEFKATLRRTSPSTSQTKETGNKPVPVPTSATAYPHPDHQDMRTQL